MEKRFRILVVCVCVVLLTGGAVILADDADGCDVLKFQQLPLDGVSLDGTTLFPFFGHDELSTAYGWYEGDAGTTPEFIGYRGCYMADDFADNKDTPVICLRWWGSYLDNQRFQPVNKFLIVFESDIPAIGDPGTPDYTPSHPGVVLSTEVVALGSGGTSPLAPGEYSETIVSDGGAPCYEHLYEYYAVLKKPFNQEPDTVYWIKIVALVDLDLDIAMWLEECLIDAAGGTIDLCDYLEQDPFVQSPNCPELTRWGWHNRDYRVKNSEAASGVLPGERNQKDQYGTPGFETDVWHFQDDCVSGHVEVEMHIDDNNPNCTDCLVVRQRDYQPQNYVFDSKCKDSTQNLGVDGPSGIERFSKDLAFELYTHEGTFDDCNGNGIDDAIDISSGFSDDCNGNGIPDECETDCNRNGIPDDCDIAAGTSDDCNGNGIPDECEKDCNCNGVDDAIDIATGFSKDCNGNGIPDECETDCNGNNVPDDCDIASGFSDDCNGNGIPDECEKDCNNNGIPDDCDIASGFSKDLNNNGIPDECEPPCQRPSVWQCLSGNKDDFVTSDGSEPASPSNYLINNPGYCYYGGMTEFDELPTNTCFIHTINNCCWPASQKVIAATMEIRLKAGPFIPQTDSLIFKQNATVLWSISLNDLIDWQTSGADTLWNSGQAETFILNLEALPTSTTATVDILSDMSNGFLDVIVADDTGVDYIELTVTTCPCRYQAQLQYDGGIVDAFVLPTEPTSAGPELLLVGTTSKEFDDGMVNRAVRHTFANLPPNILSGTLEIRLRSSYNAAACNDTIGLQANNVGSPSLAWNRRLGTGGAGSWCAGPAGLLATVWGSGSDTTLTLNLSALPNADSTTTCLIARMNADDRLDVYVQDDTMVDYMILRINTCCRRVVRRLIADVNDDLTVNLLDLAEVGRQWLETAIAPLNIDPSDGACPGCP